MPGWLSPWELALILLVILLLFGAKRLPELGRSLGSGMREFKDSVTGGSKDKDAKEKAALPPGEEAEAGARSQERSEQKVG